MDINQIESADSPPVSEMINKSEDERVRARISSDLTQKQESYRNKSAFMNQMINQTELSESTVRRYIKGETTPNFEAIKKIYAFILNKNKDEVSLNDYPSEIKDFYFRSNITDRKDINELLNRSDAHREIYWLTSNNSIVNIKSLSQYHGIRTIMTAIKDLEEEKIIKFIDDDHITSGPTGESINFEFIKDNIKHMHEKVFDRKSLENDSKTNSIRFSIFNFNETGEENAYNKIYELVSYLQNQEKVNPGSKKVSLSLIYENLSNVFALSNKGEVQ